MRARHTDFVVLHASRGLPLLEVKDRTLGSLRRFDRDSVELPTGTGPKRLRNPLARARRCTLRLTDALSRDPAPRRADGPHAGKIVRPWAYGIVLAGIDRDEFERHELGAVLPEHLVVCRDEMVAAVDAEAFRTRLFPRARHGAVMIDEEHDFEPDWLLRPVVGMIDPDSDSPLRTTTTPSRSTRRGANSGSACRASVCRPADARRCSG